MKLLSFKHHGSSSYGVMHKEGVVDLGILLGSQAIDLKTFIENGLYNQVSQILKNDPKTISLSELEFEPVIPNPGKIVCIGLNYLEHVEEGGRKVTESPTIFLRTNESQTGHNQGLVLPPESDKFDYEGEIAIVIGKEGRRISEENAWEHIAGYACYNDGSIRDWQWSTSQWTPGKNFWKTASFGPWMVTADEIPPNKLMTLITRLNGQEMQRATTDMMIYSIPTQIAYISSFMPLAAGDVIVTGTPGGVGSRRTPPVYMKAGDVVEIEVDAIGVLHNEVVAE